MMKIQQTHRPGRRTRRLPQAGLALALLGLLGCGGEELNLAPTSFDEVEQTLSQIDAMLDVDPHDPAAHDALQTLQPHLDALNHLVARVTISDDHTVSFYEVAPGVIGISESAPEGEDRMLTDADVVDVPVVDIYERLAGQPAPTALVNAQAREELEADDALLPPSSNAADEAETVFELGQTQSALTSGQGQFFRDNYCFTGGEFRGCYPNFGGNRYAQANAKTSFFTVAPYSGNISVRFKYSGSTQFTTPVFAGEVRSFWWHSSSYDPAWPPFSPRRYRRRTHRWDIIHASGNFFHWTHAFRWSCGYLDCNAWPR